MPGQGALWGHERLCTLEAGSCQSKSSQDSASRTWAREQPTERAGATGSCWRPGLSHLASKEPFRPLSDPADP